MNLATIELDSAARSRFHTEDGARYIGASRADQTSHPQDLTLAKLKTDIPE